MCVCVCVCVCVPPFVSGSVQETVMVKGLGLSPLKSLGTLGAVGRRRNSDIHHIIVYNYDIHGVDSSETRTILYLHCFRSTIYLLSPLLCGPYCMSQSDHHVLYIGSQIHFQIVVWHEYIESITNFAHA